MPAGQKLLQMRGYNAEEPLEQCGLQYGPVSLSPTQDRGTGFTGFPHPVFQADGLSFGNHGTNECLLVLGVA